VGRIRDDLARWNRCSTEQVDDMKVRALRTTASLLLPAVFLGCGLVAAVIAIPLSIVSRVLSIGVGIRIGSEGANSIEEELNASGIVIDRHEVDVVLRDDGTFEGVLEIERTVTGVAGLPTAQRSELTYDPATQQVELLFGEVRKPDGTTVACDPRSVIDRPSAASETSPGFVATRTATALFPQLSVGSRTLVKWRFVERGASPLGFHYAWRTPFALDVGRASFRIHHPAGMKLFFGERGGFRVAQRQDGASATVEAVLEGYRGQTPERGMVAPRDLCPIFVISSFSSREGIGAAFHASFRDKVEVTPAIREASAKIVGGRSGIDAARAIHRWIAQNVHYLAVYLNEGSTWIPRPAEAVLATGYGDCKDQVALLIALLSAQGIEAFPVLVDRSTSFEPLPVASPLEYDHCVAYLPQFDLYSDPTDPTKDLGELDIGMQDEEVVFATPEGRVARTPASIPEQNGCKTTHRLRLRDDGSVVGTSKLELLGRPASRVRGLIAKSGDASRVAQELLFAAPEGGFGRLTSTDPADLDTPLVCDGEFESEIVVTMGDELVSPIPTGIDLITPAGLRRFSTDGPRCFPLLASACHFEWSIEYELPEGYAITRLPAPVAVGNSAGSFESRYDGVDTRRLTVTRRLRVAKDRFAPSENEEFQALVKVMLGDSHAVIVAKKR